MSSLDTAGAPAPKRRKSKKSKSKRKPEAKRPEAESALSPTLVKANLEDRAKAGCERAAAPQWWRTCSRCPRAAVPPHYPVSRLVQAARHFAEHRRALATRR
jgi:hypothetical protein